MHQHAWRLKDSVEIVLKIHQGFKKIEKYTFQLLEKKL